MKSLITKIVVLFLFLLSGVCGLVYEVAWSKYLSLFIGSSAYSHMIVLATYMGGLAIGAFAVGKYSDKVKNRLKLYGLLELGIGFYCLAYPIIIESTGKLFVQTSTAFDGSSQQEMLLALRFFLSFITLILPTVLMGGTLPVLARFMSSTNPDSGKDVARLYYINSLGAVIGTALAGFFLVRTMGLDITVWIASSFNIIIGLFALLLAILSKPVVQSLSSKRKANEQHQLFSGSAIRIAIFTAFASGFITMLYELTWIRLLSNILGSTTYSFTVMLIAFISGIAIGSYIVSMVINKIKNLVAFLALCQVGTAISIILILPVYQRLPYYLLKLSAMIPNEAENFPVFLSLEFLFCFAIMILPTILSGMSLPVASRIANRDMLVLGKSIGGIFSINTIGAVAGVLITGLVLIPFLGVKQSIEFGAVLNGLIGLFILSKTSLPQRVKLGFALFIFVIAVAYRFLFPSWNDNFLISGVFRTLNTQDVPSYREFKIQQIEGQKILWYKEGVNANVAIRESKFGDAIQKTLVINGKTDASTVADLHTQILLGQIPLLFYPNTGGALVIGLGSGITCGSVLTHPVKSLDVVEISPEVVECNSYFTKENNNFMADPRVKIYIDDALTQLKTSSKKYDYIISEPSNPWIAGIGNLYSQEFFSLCKERLSKNGVLTQWFHTYDVNNDIFRLVLSTISNVFQHVTIWKVSDADIIILASANPLALSYGAMASKMNQSEIAGDLSRIKVFDIPALLSMQVVSARNNPFAYVKNDINTAKKPLLEFLAPVALFTHESVSLLNSLDERFSFQDNNLWLSDYAAHHPLSFDNYKNIARYSSASRTGDLAIAYTALRKALEIEPENEEALAMITKITSDLRLPDVNFRKSQIEEFRLMYELNPNNHTAIFDYLNVLVDYYRIENSIVNPQQMDDAVELMQKCIQNSQGNEEQFHYILAMILTGAGRNNEAAAAFEDLMQYRNPDGTGTSLISENELIYSIGVSYYNAGNLLKAEEYFDLLKSLDTVPDNVSAMQRKIALKKNGIR